MRDTSLIFGVLQYYRHCADCVLSTDNPPTSHHLSTLCVLHNLFAMNTVSVIIKWDQEVYIYNAMHGHELCCSKSMIHDGEDLVGMKSNLQVPVSQGNSYRNSVFSLLNL